jgi:ubiquinone/menaquinone biosynthesis C-methylase UbiE
MEAAKEIKPDLFFETINAYQHSAALKAAVDLDIFTAIASGGRTYEEIAEICKASERGVRIICDAMTTLGFIHKRGDIYSLTDMTAMYLDKKSSTYIGGTIGFLMSDKLMEGFAKLSKSARNGGSVVSEKGSLAPESPMWVKFAKYMSPMMVQAKEAVVKAMKIDPEKSIKVLDVGAGHGEFGIEVAKNYRYAQVYALDWKNVLEIAWEHAAKAGIVERFHMIEGSAFEVEIGDGWDVVLLPNFLHHFDPETNTEFLKKIAKGLNPDGKVITLEFLPNQNRISPRREALFSLAMLASTPGGDSYTFQELAQMFAKAGFGKSEHFPIKGTPQHIVVSIL